MANIVVLGSGAAIPTADRHNPAYVFVSDGKETCLLDCGEGTQSRMEEMKKELNDSSLQRQSVKTVFITHPHPDHVLGLPGLAYTLNMLKTPELTVYCPKGAEGQIQTLIQAALGAGEGKASLHVNVIPVEPSLEKPIYEGKDFKAYAFKVNHGEGVPAVGYVMRQNNKTDLDMNRCKELGVSDGRMFGMLKKGQEVTLADGKVVKPEEVLVTTPGAVIVYTGDCVPGLETFAAAKNADILIHDSSYLTADQERAETNGHSTAAQVGEIANEAGVKSVILAHVSNMYDLKKAELLGAEARDKCPTAQIVVAHDGLTVSVAKGAIEIKPRIAAPAQVKVEGTAAPAKIRTT